MLLNAAAPEWSLGRALADYLSVRSCERDFNAFAEKDGVKWTRTHTQFANLGGFSIRFSQSTGKPEEIRAVGPVRNPEELLDRLAVALAAAAAAVVVGPSARSVMACTDPEKGTRTSQPLPNEIQHRYKIFRKFLLSRPKLETAVRAQSKIIGPINWATDGVNDAAVSEALDNLCLDWLQGDWERRKFLRGYRQIFNNLAVLCGNLWVLDAHQILLARRLGIIASLPDVDEDALDDRNKGDIVVKLIALAQILWFLIQLATRLVRGISTSQLEILTLAYTASTAITYLLLLDKPKDVQHSIVIPAARYGRPQDVTRIALHGPTTALLARRGIWISNNGVHADFSQGFALATLWGGAILSNLVFGLVHCIAWEFTFPTAPEKVLWHVSSITTAVAVPVAGLIMYSFVRVLDIRWGKKGGKEKAAVRATSRLENSFSSSIFLSTSALFLFARVFILVEVLRSLGFQPPTMFATTWSANLPHIG